MKTSIKALTALALASTCLQAEKTYDAVARGKAVYESMGCMVCHSVDLNDPSIKTGPNLYGLFLTKARKIEVLNAESGNKQRRKANKDYFIDSVRESMNELAIARTGETKGTAYPAGMPPFSEAAISNTDLDSLFHYLRSRADKGQAGPAKVMLNESQSVAYKSLIDIPEEVLVSSRPRVIRAGVQGLSARSLHVGQPNGIHYSFDQRFLSVRRIWSGGFLNLKEERRGRAGQPSALGHNANIILDDEPLLAPLTADGEIVDFEFKEPDFADMAAIKKYVWEKTDFQDRLANLDAEFLGHDLSATTGTPSFRFRVGKNEITETIDLTEKGVIEISLKGIIREKQQFKVGNKDLTDVSASGATLAGGVLTLSPGDQVQKVSLKAKLAGKIAQTIAAGGTENREPQVMGIMPSKPVKRQQRFPAGYSVMSWSSPLDLYGRPQLFEPTGIAVAKNGTIVVSTRTAGVWRIRDGYWSLFAEGTFESLGVCIEDDKGDQIVISQKPELTRISDTDGDGCADHFETVCDDFGIHGNYHEYTHGPVRDTKGNYYFNLNLAHENTDARASVRAGGKFMGSMGGYRGWSCRVSADGKFSTFASGLRSPAGIGIDPDGRLWYAENQGEYVGSSKVVPLEEGKFYGHPSGLEALPGMTPDSPEVAPKQWSKKLRKGAVWLPHRKLSNAPGNPVWDTTNGKFSKFAGQMFIGDQTLSTLLRVVTEKVNGIDQGCVIPFSSGFSSGIMRPVFLPDGSLLLGQTGRGWGARGGEQEGLQQMIWDGKTETADFEKVAGDTKGFAIHLTQPLSPEVTESQLLQILSVNSWFYTNNHVYGSPEHDKRTDMLSAVKISGDRQLVTLQLTDFGKGDKWLDRIYHIQLPTKSNLFKVKPARGTLEAYFTLRAIAD